MLVQNESDLPVHAALYTVVRLRRGAALGLPVRRDGVLVLAVALRYVAEVGLYARFPVQVQLSDQAFSDMACSSRKNSSLSVEAQARALMEIVKIRWRDWLMIVGQKGLREIFDDSRRGLVDCCDVVRVLHVAIARTI